MNNPKTAQVPGAITHYSDLDLSSQHITTSNFMELNVAKIMELVPKQSINIDMTTFTRLAPMPVPTFGNADIHNRAYFVPARTIMRGWNEFIDDTISVNGDGSAFIPAVPRFYNQTFVDYFMTSGSLEATEDNYDFEFIRVNTNTGARTLEKRRFTPFGKWTYKLLRSLGYGIVFEDGNSTSHSALPLLSIVKIFYDWYYPSAYVDNEFSISLRKLFEYNHTSDWVDFADYVNDNYLLPEIFAILWRVSYDSDYFVSSWDNPVAPNNGAFSEASVNDITDSSGSMVLTNNLTNGTPFLYIGADTVSQYALDALKALNDYMKRHQLSGARTLDRYLSRWGVKLPDANLNRSVLVGSKDSKIQFGDVTSTSDTAGAQLGDYAGKGIGLNQSEGFVNFSTGEFGYLVIISTIVPKTAYYQGADRMTRHFDRLDFYSPEFDSLGVQGLSKHEVFIPTHNYNAEELKQSPYGYSAIDSESIFGFVPRYSEYKRGYDQFTGDLTLPGRNVGQEGWTLMRDLYPFYKDVSSYSNMVHNQEFVEGLDADQYNRIFYVTDNVEDKFRVIHNFVIKTRFPGKAMYDSYEFKEEDKAQKVTIDINGVRQN